MEKLKVINLLAGPGAGKSTTRAGLFYKMKTEKILCEEVTEYAKDVTWDENFSVLSDQLFVLANQNRRLDRLKGKVDWVISDSPLLLSIHYATPDYLPSTFRNLAFDLWNSYDNYNFFIKRTKAYVQSGRTQTESEAREIDDNILRLLHLYGIPHVEIDGGPDAPDKIVANLKERGLV